MNRSLALVFLPVAVIGVVGYMLGVYAIGWATGRWDIASKRMEAVNARLKAAAAK